MKSVAAIMTERDFVPSDLPAYLHGAWRIDRLVEDRLAGATHRMHGNGAFQPDGAELAYSEAVSWTLDGQMLTGERAYRYAFPAPQAAPRHAEVRFADGRLFHTLDVEDGHCEVAHDCPPDRYDGLYVLLDDDRFRVRWTVVGPRKDLVLSTLYSRVG